MTEGMESMGKGGEAMQYTGTTADFSSQFPAGMVSDRWRLRLPLLVTFSHECSNQNIAEVHIAGQLEWGEGATVLEAIHDLITTLGELRESLNKRREQLGTEGLAELKVLDELIERIQEKGGDMKPFWMVYVDGGGGPIKPEIIFPPRKFGDEVCLECAGRWESREAAHAEAERLTREERKTSFVLEAIEMCETSDPPIKWSYAPGKE